MSQLNPGTTLVVVTSIFAALSLSTTALRIGTKILQRQMRSEDWTILASEICLIVQVVFVGLEYHYGAGSHIFLLAPEDIMSSLKFTYATEFLLFPALCLTKISICFFVLRIKSTRPLRYGLYAMMALLIVPTIMCLIVLFAQCQPLNAFWDRAAGTCWDPVYYNDIIWSQVATSIFSDVVCTLLPIVVLWNVRIPLKLKFAVCGLMGLGLLTTICGAIRASLSNNDMNPDLTYYLSFISIWALLEAHIGVIGANMALARYVWIYFFGKPEASSTQPTRGYKNGYQSYGREFSGVNISHKNYGVERSVITPTDDMLLRDVSALSDGSVSDGIRKTTTIRVRDEGLHGANNSSLHLSSMEEGKGPLGGYSR